MESLSVKDQEAVQKIKESAQEKGFDLSQGKIRRSSSRFCLSVEHGDYNGTKLFGVGTNRFLWLGYQPNSLEQAKKSLIPGALFLLG